MKLLYRADGGYPIGTGHIFRAVRLIAALRERGQLCARLMLAEDAAALQIVGASGAQLCVLPPRRDKKAVKPLLQAAPVLEQVAVDRPDVIVVDMLDTPEEEMAALAATGVPLVTFDDRGPGRFHADLIVNVLVTEPTPPLLRPETRLLEGPAYAVLDPIYAEAHRNPLPRTFGEKLRVLVTMGGADAAGLTVKVARALRRNRLLTRQLEEVEFTCGPAFPHRARLEKVLESAPWPYQIHVGLPNLLDCYRRCDVAIVAGGLTMYEVCCVGIPSLAVCQPIDHQVELAERLKNEWAIWSVGYGREATEAQIAYAVMGIARERHRRRLAARGPELVDGRGAERVAEALIEIAKESHRLSPNQPAQNLPRLRQKSRGNDTEATHG